MHSLLPYHQNAVHLKWIPPCIVYNLQNYIMICLKMYLYAQMCSVSALKGSVEIV